MWRRSFITDFTFFFSKSSSKNVNKGNCRSYFSALGAADFSVASKILNKGSELFREATVCLVSDVFFVLFFLHVYV